MADTLKDFFDKQQTERIAHIVIRNFSKITNRELTEDERDFVVMVADSTFEKYVVEHKENIFVADAESEEKLSALLGQFTDNLSGLIVHYIYSRLEAYILFKQVKALED